MVSYHLRTAGWRAWRSNIQYIQEQHRRHPKIAPHPCIPNTYACKSCECYFVFTAPLRNFSVSSHFAFSYEKWGLKGPPAYLLTVGRFEDSIAMWRVRQCQHATLTSFLVWEWSRCVLMMKREGGKTVLMFHAGFRPVTCGCSSM